MDFFGRKSELALLESLSAKGGGFIVITGRRRVGKTELVRQFLRGKRSCYLYINQGQSKDALLEDMASQVERDLGGSGVRYTTFAAFFRHLFLDLGPVVVAIDEFQRLQGTAPEAISELQQAVDLHLQRSQATLLVSGSSMGMMRRIFEESGAPLFKRADAIITLRPFSFPETCELLEGMGIHGKEARLDLYSLFGGVVFYYRLMERYGAVDLDSSLRLLLLNDLAPLAREPMDIMMEEFGRQHGTYFEILKAMAAGRSARGEIADRTHVEATSLSHYLDDLSQLLGVVESEVPVTEEMGKSRRGRYRIADPFFRFYFRFIWPRLADISMGRYDRLAAEIEEQWPAHRGTVFEDIALAHMRRSMADRYSDIGRYWSRRGEEVDILLFDRDRREALILECKAASLGVGEALGELNRLEDKWSGMPLHGYQHSLGLICISARTDERWPMEALLLTLDELTRGWKHVILPSDQGTKIEGRPDKD